MLLLNFLKGKGVPTFESTAEEVTGFIGRTLEGYYIIPKGSLNALVMGIIDLFISPRGIILRDQ